MWQSWHLEGGIGELMRVEGREKERRKGLGAKRGRVGGGGWREGEGGGELRGFGEFPFFYFLYGSLCFLDLWDKSDLV